MSIANALFGVVGALRTLGDRRGLCFQAETPNFSLRFSSSLHFGGNRKVFTQGRPTFHSPRGWRLTSKFWGPSHRGVVAPKGLPKAFGDRPAPCQFEKGRPSQFPLGGLILGGGGVHKSSFPRRGQKAGPPFWRRRISGAFLQALGRWCNLGSFSTFHKQQRVLTRIMGKGSRLFRGDIPNGPGERPLPLLLE